MLISVIRRHLAHSFALIVWLALVHPTVMAADNSQTEPVQPELQPEPQSEEALEASALEKSQQLQYFEDRIATLESTAGPYDPSLIEALTDMARYSMEIGQPQTAAELYERALNVTRISDGLYSETQLPILEALTEAHRAASNWQTTDDREYLAFHLKSRLYPPGSQAYADAVMTLARWKLQALQGNLLRRSSNSALQDINELHDAYRAALMPLDESMTAKSHYQPVDSPTRLSLLYGKAQAEFQYGAYMANSVPSYLRFPVERYVSEYVCQDVVGADGQVRRACGTVRRENPRYYEYEREKSRYRSGIRSSLLALSESVEALRSLVAQNTDLVGTDEVPASVRLGELEKMEADLQRGYRRSAVW